MRSNQFKCRRGSASLVAALGLLAANGRVASAQDARPRTGDVAAERFAPAPGPNNLLVVETARVPSTFAYSFGLVVDYARDPLRLRSCTPTTCDAPGVTPNHLHVVRDLGTATVLAAITPIDRLQLGLRVPVHYIVGDGIVTDPTNAGYGGPQPGGIQGFAMGDPSLEAKVRAIGKPSDPLNAGISVGVSAPLGHQTADGMFAGYGSPAVDARAVVDLDLNRFFLAANVGGAFKSNAVLGSLDLGSELRFGAGGGLRMTRAMQLLIETFGFTNFSSASGTNGAEVDSALRFLPVGSPVALTVGGGTGLNQGVGVPAFRVFAGVSVFVEKRDSRSRAEDPDLDKDGIVNAEDKCPREGGDVVRIPGPFYGCPKRDSDGDAVQDHLDACPDKPGVATLDPKTNGCPPEDRDNDGIPNDKDKCPDSPETYNGFEDDDGCPDIAPVRAEVRPDQIVINERINFAYGTDQIVGQRSFEALDLVAKVLVDHPEIKRLEIAGHTDNVGSDSGNLELSKRRAAAVVAYLVKHGVEPSRLVSAGYGASMPIAKNDSEEGRATNRRVMFNILLVAK